MEMARRNNAAKCPVCSRGDGEGGGGGGDSCAAERDVCELRAFLGAEPLRRQGEKANAASAGDPESPPGRVMPIPSRFVL